MKKIAFLFLIGALAFGGCDLFKSKKSDKKPAVKDRAKADLREENTLILRTGNLTEQARNE